MAVAYSHRESNLPAPASHQAEDEPDAIYVRALYAYDGSDAGSLPFQQGDIIEVNTRLESGWWDGDMMYPPGPRGWFPSNYVVQITQEEAQFALEQAEALQAEVDMNAETRTGPMESQRELEQALWASLGQDGAEDLTSFSTGGDIFAEIAAASTVPNLDSSDDQDDDRLASSAGTSPDLAGAPRRKSVSKAHPYQEEQQPLRQSQSQDYWMPQVSENGQITYFNSRTGETALDMPVGGSSRTGSMNGAAQNGHQSSPQESQVRSRSRQNSGSSQSITAAFYDNLHREQSMRRPSQGQSQESEDWVQRSTADGASFYQNRRTGERLWSPPSSSTLHSVPNSGRRQSLSGNPAVPSRMIASTSQRPSTAPEANSLSPQMPQTAHSRLSFTSEDQAPDDRIQMRRFDPSDASSHRTETRPSFDGTENGSIFTFLPAALEVLEPSPLPTLAMLQSKAQYTITELIECSHPKRSAIQRSDTTGDDPALHQEREEIARLATLVMADVRQLLHSIGILGYSSGSSSRPAPGDDVGVAAQLRQYTKKVTSPLSKLVLSVRAVWGLMGTSREEEERAQELINEAASEEHAQELRAHRSYLVSMRIESERKLRLDIVVGAREVSEALAVFVDQARGLLQNLQSPLGDVNRITGQKRPEAILRTNVAALLAPGGGYGGNWRGNGLSVLPAHQPKITPGTVPVPNVKYGYPRRRLDEDTMAMLSIVASGLAAEVASIRSLASVQQSQALARKGSGVSLNSQMSERSVGETPALSSSSQHPQASKEFARLTKLSLQANKLLSALSGLLSIIEDLDIAAAVDVEVDSSSVSSLIAYQNSVMHLENEDTSSTVRNGLQDYRTSLLQARKHMSQLEEAKQTLYNSLSSLVVCVQSLSMAQNVSSSASESDHAPSRAQPTSSAPLSDFTTPSLPLDPLEDLLNCLMLIDQARNAAASSLDVLYQIAVDQAQVPDDLRSASQDQRAKLTAHRLSQSSFSSSIRSNASSIRPAHPITRNIHSSQSLSIVPLSSDYENEGPRSGTALGDSYRPSKARHGHRGSIADSIASSNMSGHSGNSQSSLIRNQAQARTKATDLAYAQSSPTRSPSNNKIRKFFGDDVPVATFSPSGQANGSPSRGEAKLKKFFGDTAPPPFLTERGAPSPRDEHPWYLQADFVDEIAIGADGLVRGGTLRALVARLTPHNAVDQQFTVTFLLTYRTFTTSRDFFRHLVQRYTALPPSGLNQDEYEIWVEKKQKLIRIRIISVLKTWIENHLWDEDVSNLLRDVHDFAMTGLGDSTAAQQIGRVVQKRRANSQPEIRPPASAGGSAPNPIVPRNTKKMKFLDIDATEFARQLTIKNYQLFAAVPPGECFSKAWPRQFDTFAPRLTALSELNNATTGWVKETVLAQEDPKKRASSIKHFITIAEKCLKLQNFSTLMMIVAGLNAAPVVRLKRTWEQVNQRTMATWQYLNDLMAPDKNSSKYRQALRTIGPPCVPYLGVFLSTWTFVGEGNPDYLRENQSHINFSKRQKAAEIMQQIQLYQSTSYNLEQSRAISDFLDNAFGREQDEGALWKLSLDIEPRERQDEAIARLLSESGFL